MKDKEFFDNLNDPNFRFDRDPNDKTCDVLMTPLPFKTVDKFDNDQIPYRMFLTKKEIYQLINMSKNMFRNKNSEPFFTIIDKIKEQYGL